jgi:hypothetical protein
MRLTDQPIGIAAFGYTQADIRASSTERWCRRGC